jgi:hypothetical protein
LLVCQLVQEDATNLAREKKELQREIDSLKRRLETAESSAQNFERAGKGGQDAAADASQRVRRLEEELEDERRRNSTRVSETPQFVQMRKMMQSQNSKIRDLRYRSMMLWGVVAGWVFVCTVKKTRALLYILSPIYNTLHYFILSLLFALADVSWKFVFCIYIMYICTTILTSLT